jgi:halimadienyl-diphosphate synthase
LKLTDQIHELLRGLRGRLGPSPYDIAWMARVPANGGGETRWPELVDWLIEHQWLDGSWGGAVRYYHDRILCTLAAIIALREHNTGEVHEAIERGTRYIWHNLHRLRHDPFELVGFELIFPSLLTQARSLGLDVPTHTCGYGRIRTEKLRLLPIELLYSPGTSVAFSLEFLDNRVDIERMHYLQGSNGAIANSPATTAYFALRADGNSRALEYLEGAKTLSRGVPAFYPFRTFEITWALEHLAFGGLSLKELVEQSVWKDLQNSLHEKGVSMDPSFGIYDGDTTAVTVHVLRLGEYEVNPAILHRFEEPNSRIFRTFDFERNASVSTNAHALGALAEMPDYPDRREVIDRITAFLLAHRLYDTYWVDKWHSSPYYATSHTLIALLNLQKSLVPEFLTSIEWILHTQRDDGSWGYFDRGTAEETAYALLALLHYHKVGNAVNPDILKKGISFLHLDVEQGNQTYPDLWIAKSLFAPYSVIRAAILGAIHLYQDTFGHILA